MAVRYINRKSIFFLLTFFLFIFLTSARAQQEYYYKQISLSEGLTQSTVRCILNDHRGFVWIGTKYGLNRFDRYELKSYFYSREHSNSLPGNQINFIIEDRDRNIWISTENGLVRYNSDTDDFTRISYKGKPLIVGSAVEFDNGVWFGGNGTVYKFSYNSAHILEPQLITKIQPNDIFTGMKLWKKDIILLRTRRNGVWMYNLSGKKLVKVPFIQDKEIISMHIDSQQRIWISPYGNGIKGYNKDGTIFAHFNSSNSNLTNNVVLDILEKDGGLWLGTDGGGISILDEKKSSFITLSNIPGNASSLPESSILTLYKDHENNIWAGSIRGGLIAIKPVFFHTYHEAPLNSKYGLSEKTVLSLYEDGNKMLWIGTDGGGVNRLDQKNLTFKHFPATYGLKVASITEFGADELLLSAFSKGIYIFNKVTGKIVPFMADFTRINQSKGLAINLNKVDGDNVYLFTGEVFRYNLSDKRIFKVSDHNPSKPESSLLKIYSDTKVTYLFAAYGIFKFDHLSNKLSTVFTLKQRDNPLTAVCRDSKGTFWLANRDGLMYYNAREKKLTRVKTNLFESISSIVVDTENRLWIGARNMVFMYLIEEDKFVAFGESDGVIPNEFLFKPSLVTRNGNIYMGGVKGLLHINKNIPSLPSSSPVIELMDLELNGVPLNTDKDGNSRSVAIPRNHSSLILRVMTREDDVFRKKMFRFEIKGMDFKPIETYDHALTIGSLPQGDYRVIVSCSLKNGGWSKPFDVLKISISPPWFLSFWFLCLIFVITVAVVFFLYKAAITKRERKLQWKKKEYEQQTYEEKIRFLINISHELRTPLTLIYSPLRRILKEKNIDLELAKKLTGIYGQANHMKDIIDMVLDVRKIELGKERLKLETQDINTWVWNIGNTFSEEFEAKGVKLRYELDNDISSFSFDKQKCEIVLTNLLINALKFSPQNTETLVSTRMLGGFVQVAIRDQGIGLNNVDLNELFQSFYQGKHHFGGSGIGLSYSKILIEMHGGQIGAFNNTEIGSTFYFELPYGDTINVPNSKPDLKSINTVQIENGLKHLTENELATNNYTLLIVEDEPSLRTFLKDNLCSQFKRIYEAGNGLEALKLLEKSPVDIIVSDVMMPEIDGFEFCRLLKENLTISHIPIILLTTQGDMQSRDIGYKLGADGYLSKPFDLDFLLTRLDNILKNRKLIKAKYRHNSLFIQPQDGTYSTADEKFIAKLNSLIVENLENPELDVDFLIDKMAMSRASLYSKLKSIGDIGVNDYINKLRLERAAHLLTSTDKSIMEITEVIGFANQRYFSTVFKEFYKMTPTQYRKIAIKI